MKVDFPVTLIKPIEVFGHTLDSEDVLWAYEKQGLKHKLCLDEESLIPGIYIEGRDFIKGHKYAIEERK